MRLVPSENPRFTAGVVIGNSLRLFYRDGTRVCHRDVPAEYTVHFRLSELGKARHELERSSQLLRATVDGEWLRTSWKSWDSRARLLAVADRQGRPIANWFQTQGIVLYEADVSPVQRYFADTCAEVEPSPRVVYLDLETDSRLPFARKTEMRILVWAVIEGCTDAAEVGVLQADTDAAEAVLLRRLIVVLESADVVAAWNGDGFDFPVLLARCRKHNIAFPARLRLLDHLVVFRDLNSHTAESGEEKQSMALDAIAHSVLGYGKHAVDATKSWDAWEAGGESRTKLAEYCEQDARLMREIEQKTHYIALFGTICAACRVFLETRSMLSTVQMDGFMLRLGQESGYHFPTPFEDHDGSKFRGAYVMEPKGVGILKNVHVADFSGMYPSIIVTWNMSPETKDPRHPVNGPIHPDRCRCPKTGIAFRTDVKGILPRAIEDLIALRKEWNAKKSAAVPGTDDWRAADRWSSAYKILANSFYGVVGAPTSRYYDRNIAESVSQNGVWLIELTISEATASGMSVLYADTDSIFVSDVGREAFSEFVGRCNTAVYPPAIARVGCKENRVSLAYEKAYERIVFVAAKKYVGRYAHYKGKDATSASKPEIKGLEYKRSDSMAFARSLQLNVIEFFVAGCEDLDEYERLVRRHRDRFFQHPIDLADVVLFQTLSKAIGEYKAVTPPAHVRVAMELRKAGEDVSVGTRIQYFIRGEKDGRIDACPASQWDGQFDREYVWEGRVYPATQRLLQAMFPASDWARLATLTPRSKRTIADVCGADVSVTTKIRPPSKRNVKAGQGSFGF